MRLLGVEKGIWERAVSSLSLYLSPPPPVCAHASMCECERSPRAPVLLQARVFCTCIKASGHHQVFSSLSILFVETGLSLDLELTH